MSESPSFCGRTFRAHELELLRQMALEFSALGVTEIARTVCELLDWTRPNGGLKNHECRQLLERLQAEGFLQLPELRKLGGRGPRRADGSRPCCEPTLVEGAARERASGIDLGGRISREPPMARAGGTVSIWDAACRSARTCATGCGIASGSWPVCFGPRRAWKMQARDAWVGWSDQPRRHNLQSIVNKGRFLMLPGVRVKGLASKILAPNARQTPRDWENRYGCPPLLLETLVDAARFRGTCYRAANWIYIGQTVGRGRMDRERTAHGQAVKDIYVYPLVPDARQRLSGNLTR